MNKEPFSELVYSRNVIEFATVANEFCSFIEQVEQFQRKDFVARLQKLFPLLYLKAALLPEPDLEMSEEAPEKFVSEDDYNYILHKLELKLGQFDAYYDVFDPSIHLTEAAVEANISENVTDIYQDLKDFILAYRIGTLEVMNDALWECRNNFEQFWGQRLVNGLRAIHNLVYGEADIEESDIQAETDEKDE
ncbi:MAG: DUF5063 domain-containing protein [Mariniphaga sp.]